MSAGRYIKGHLRPVPVLALTVLWVLLWGQVSPTHVVGGLIVAVGVLLAFPLPRLILGIRVRPWALVVLVVRFIAELVTASVEVAYQSVAPWKHPHGVCVRVGIRTQDAFFTTMLAQMTILVPGTVVIDVDRHRRELLLHVFDAPDDAALEAVQRDVLAQEERILRALSKSADEVLARRPGELRTRRGASAHDTEPDRRRH